MTLILSFVSHEYAIQVSDRRLVYVHRDGTTTVADDDANKVVIFYNRLMFSYTGLANIGDFRTDQWLARTMAACHTIPDACDAIAESATRDLKHTRHFLAIEGVGWALHKADTPEPIIVSITNAPRDAMGNYLYDRLESHFRFEYAILPVDVPYFVRNVGQPIEVSAALELERFLRKRLKRDASPSLIASILGRCLLRTASGNKKVGRDLLIMSVPKRLAVLPTGPILIGAKPDREHITTYYFSEANRSVVQHGPAVVAGGVAIGYVGGGPVGSIFKTEDT